ncbi:MAG: hypothetical protein QY326_08145 [Bdellovibrionota bacterium]|nr:MAG: hypothetical protein QY326_08145 [Bdellovibrionota bacterium]
MKLPKFYKLRHAVANLDVHFLAKKIAELENRLTREGQSWELAHTAVTEEGVFYINPESGMATRVVLYEADHRVHIPSGGKRRKAEVVEIDDDNLDNLNPYHLLRCNTLTKIEREERVTGYRIAQRLDGTFFYRYVRKGDGAPSPEDVLEEIESQRLAICPNCFFKVTSLLEGVGTLTRETFKLEQFFNVDFFRSWCRYGEFARTKGSLSGMYPKDWDEICRIRKEQVQYHCESCSEDFSEGNRAALLYVHPTDHYKNKVSFVKLQCLCKDCYAIQTGQKLKSGGIAI